LAHHNSYQNDTRMINVVNNKEYEYRYKINKLIYLDVFSENNSHYYVKFLSFYVI